MIRSDNQKKNINLPRNTFDPEWKWLHVFKANEENDFMKFNYTYEQIDFLSEFQWYWEMGC